MADTVVNFLLNNLSQLLNDEAKLLSGVEENVKLLQQELERINAFLRGSEGKRDEHETVKVLVRQIRDVTYEAQDVLDNYVVDVVNHRKKGMLEKFLKGFDHAKMLHSVNNQIVTIKAKIKDIYENKDKYGINEGESATANMEALALEEMVQSRRSKVEEDEVVGFDEYAYEVTKLLVQGNRKTREVVSIVGMVGCGKTTLARKVYRDPQLNKIFDCCAWEFVTNELNAKELLLNLLRSFKAISEDELKRNKKGNKEKESDSTAKAQEIAMLKIKLREYLSDMRYLIVLDDMWSSQVLEEIGDAFPDDNIGSRILITTRSQEVVSKICTIEPYKLKRLSDEDSWILLSTKVFRGEKCRPTLESAGRNIAIACKGLPLSIVVTAGILRGKEKSVQVWEKVLGNVNWYISHEDSMVKEIVKLSYESLTPRLKPCFLYFGIYPEDYDISVRQLIQLWIAEGFIPETGHGTMTQEDVAEEYLYELISRNMIQVESRRMDGGIKTCRIHDLLRELCMSKSIEDNFLEVRTDISILKEGKPRRLSLHGSTDYYMSESTCDHSSTRSLFSFSKDEYDASLHPDWLRKNFKLMRVLDMGQVKCSFTVLGKLEELIHIRYLRTRDRDSCPYSQPQSLPSSIYDLWNLETLDLRGSRLYSLPDGIWKLKRLRHLYMIGTNATLPDIPGRKILPNLQTLSTVCLNLKTALQLEKGKFPNLRKLGVDCRASSALSPIEFLRKLQHLSHLNTLKVIYGKEALTSVEGFPPNITKITLVGVPYYFLSGIVKPLGSLPKLRNLKITEDSDCLPQLELKCIEPGCFPQLQELKMTGLNCVSWKLGKGAMPQLRRLVFNRCELSASLPVAESFTTLREVEVLWSSKEVVGKLQHLVLKDVCKLTVYPALDE